MQLVKTSFDFPAQANNTWDAVRYWVGMSARLKQADLACQVMAGFALRELHQTHKIGPGQPKKELPNDLVISHRSQSWAQIVQAEVGVSDETARNWMKMADGVKSRWKKLPVRDRLSALMTVPPSQWSEPDALLISEAVHKATDMRTQAEFMWDLGIAKKPQGSGARGRKPGEGGRPKDLDMSEDTDDALLNEFRADMRLFTHPKDATLQKLSTAELLKHQAEALAYSSRITEIIKRRKAIATSASSTASIQPTL